MAIDFAKDGVVDVGSGVFVYVGPDGDSNNGIVQTGEGTISIDSFVRKLLPGGCASACTTRHRS